MTDPVGADLAAIEARRQAYLDEFNNTERNNQAWCHPVALAAIDSAGDVPGLLAEVSRLGQQLKAETEALEHASMQFVRAATERDAALALVGQLQGQLDAARAWLKSADPYRERNGDHFAELRAILAAARAVKVYERVNCDEPQSEGECYVDHEHGF